MRSHYLILIAALLTCLCFTPQAHAQKREAWMQQFEPEFSVSGKVGAVSFMYPKQFELSETTMGVFLETQELSGHISQGTAGLRSKKYIMELLVTKQGGKNVVETSVNGHAVFAATSTQGEQTCRTYIVVPSDTEEDPLYLQFRWKTDNPVDYTPMLNRLVGTMK